MKKLYAYFWVLAMLTGMSCSDTIEEGKKSPGSPEETTLQQKIIASATQAVAGLDSPTRSATGIRSVASVTPLSSPTRNAQDQSLLHLVNFQNNGGYALVIGEEDFDFDVVMMNNSGNMSAEELQDNIVTAIMLENIYGMYSEGVLEEALAQKEIGTRTNNYDFSNADYLLKTQWLRTGDFAVHIPKTLALQQSSEAVALAQGMNYYCWPAQYKQVVWSLINQVLDYNSAPTLTPLVSEFIQYIASDLNTVYDGIFTFSSTLDLYLFLMDNDYSITTSMSVKDAVMLKYVTLAVANMGNRADGKLITQAFLMDGYYEPTPSSGGYVHLNVPATYAFYPWCKLGILNGRKFSQDIIPFPPPSPWDYDTVTLWFSYDLNNTIMSLPMIPLIPLR